MSYVAGGQIVGASRHSNFVELLVSGVLETNAGIVGHHELAFRFEIIEQRLYNFHRESEPRSQQDLSVFFEYSVVKQ